LHQVLSHRFLLTKFAFGYPPIPLELQSTAHCAELKREELVRRNMLSIGKCRPVRSLECWELICAALALPFCRTIRARSNIFWRQNLHSGLGGD
jgi:hypothetical protein